MSSDNPIGNIFAKFLNKGASKSVSDYLIDITANAAPVSGGPLAAMHTNDKYGILGNIHDYRISFFDSSIQSMGEDLSRVKGMYVGRPTARGPGTNLGDLFSNINRKFKLGFGYSKTKDQLYMLSESGQQFALPLQNMAYGIDSGLVNMGGIRRGAYRAYNYEFGEEATYSQLFYSKLQQIARQSRSQKDFLRRFAKINNTSIGMSASGKNIALQSLLTSTTGIRGSNVLGIEAKMFATRARVVGLPQAELANFQKFREARYVINSITKNPGRKYAPSMLGKREITWMGDNVDPVTGLKKAWAVYDQFTQETLPGIYQRLGLVGFHHATKPENILGDKGLVVLSNLGRSMFEAAADMRQLTKGTFARYHERVITKSQQKILMDTGGSFLPLYMLRGELEGKGINNITRRAGKIAVVSERSMAAALGLTGDSGAILTSLGRQRFADKLFFGGFTIKNPLEGKKVSQRTLSALETITGRKMRIGQDIENISFGFTNREISDALAAATWRDTPVGVMDRFRSDLRDGRSTPEREAARYWRERFGSMTERQKALVTLIRRAGKSKGIFEYLVSKNVPVTMSTKMSQNGLSISFNSLHNVESNIVEGLLPNGLRFTAAGLASSHNLYGAVEDLADKHGVELIVTKEYWDKVESNTRYISNFLGKMRDAGSEMERMAIDAIGSVVPFDRYGNMQITTITSSAEAKRAAEQVVYRLQVSKIKAHRRLAASIVRGTKLTGTALKFREFTDKALRLFDIDMSRRADTALDINPLKAHRFTPGKMKTLAWNSKLMGYGDPNLDPIFSTLASHWKGMRLNAAKMDFDFMPDNLIYQYTQGLAGKATPSAADIVTFKNGKTFVGDKEIKNLPNISAFSMRSGGVSAAELEGTLLGNEYRNRLLYLDLGKETQLSKFLGKSRYLAMPNMMSRVGQTAGRYTFNKKHSYFGYMKLIDRLQSGIGITTGSINKAISTVVGKMIGKGGIMEKMHTIHTPASVAIRLSPPIFDSTSNLFNVNEMYQMKVSRRAFSEEMLRKWGLKPSQMERMLDIAKSRDFTYVMMGADPAQRGEHIGSIFKLHFTDDVVHGTDNVLAPQMHEFIKKVFERDTDRDRMNMILMEALDEGKITGAEYEKRIAHQEKLLAPSVAFLRSTFERVKGASAKTVRDIFGTYIGQKANAALGYTIARPSDRLMSIVMNDGAEGLKKLGINNLNTSTVASLNAVMREFAGNPEKQGAAMALNQFMFQAGVQKTEGGKGALRELTIALTEVSQEAAKLKYIDIEKIKARLQTPLENLIKDSDIQRFWHGANTALMGSAKGRRAMDRVMQGLQLGAEEQKALIDNAAHLMIHNIGIGAAMRPFTNNIESLGSLFEGMSQDRFSLSDFMKKVANPILGIVAPRLSSGTIAPDSIPVAPKAGMSTVEHLAAAKAGIEGAFSKIANSKHLGTAALAVVAAGAYGYMNRPDLSANLPPPVDDSMPADRGPAMPDFNNQTFISTSPNIPRMSKMTRRLDYPNMNNNYFNPSTSSRLRIEDARSPYNPWLIRQQMNKVSDSEFTY